MRPQTVDEAVDVLLQRQRIKLWRDRAKTPEWCTLPSLWEQLERSTSYSAHSQGSGGFGAQPVISMSVTALVIEIAKDAASGAAELSQRHGNVPDDLRAIGGALASRPSDDPDFAWWLGRVDGWCVKAREVLRLDPSHPRWARGVRCPNCGADSSAAVVDGQRVRTPALAITWSSPEDDSAYHADSDWLVRGVECRRCGVAWWRGPDLDGLVDAMLRANATRETLAFDESA